MLALSACRFHFAPETSDARIADTPVDAFEPDVASFCNPLVNETLADCQAAVADPTSASDQVIYDCAAGCHFAHCVIFEQPADGCTQCACPAYVKSSLICDQQGLCGPPINGTGCFTPGGNTAAPYNCPAGGTLQQTGACTVRYVAANGGC